MNKALIFVCIFIFSISLLYSQSKCDTVFGKDLTAAAIMPSIVSGQNTTKSNLGDIINNSNLTVLVQHEGTGIPDANVTLTAYSLDGDSIPNPYIGQTDDNGLLDLTVLHSAFLGVGIQENQEEKIMNTPLTVYDLGGKFIATATATGLENNTLSYKINLPSLPNAMYVLQAEINGQFYNEKFVSMNNSYIGRLSLTNSSENTSSNNFKSTTATLEDAIYDIDVTANGYQPYHSTLSLVIGDNGWQVVNMQENEGLPDHQDLTGRVYQMDDNNNITVAPNANVYVTIDGQTTLIPTDSNGDWMLNDVPCNKTAGVAFEINENYYAIEDVYYTTPVYDENTWTASDTIHGDLNALLPTKRDGTTAAHIGQHASSGTILDDILIYFNGVDETYRQAVLTDLTNFTNETPGLYNLIVSDTPVGDNGITISNDGVNETFPNTNADETPWNHTLSYTSGANTSISSPGDFLVTGHEFLRAVGHNGVGFYSIMRVDAPDYTEEDRTIQDVARHYYNAAHHGDQIHAIHINKLVEQIDSKKKENATIQEIDNVNYHFIN